MTTFPRYFKLTVMLLFLVVVFFPYTLWMLLSNPISQYLDSKIASSLQEPSHYESHSNIVSPFIFQNGSSSLSSLSMDTINNETTRINILNLTGKYVIPGLFDMHAHVAGVRKNSYNQNFSETALEMLLDYGVTTIRSPAGPTNESIALKHNVSEGNIEGPEIFTAGRLLNGPQIPIPFVEKQISTEEQAREEVRHQAEAGVDYVKLYVGLPPNLVKAAIDEAHSQGIRVIGHLYMTSWTDAANLGIDALAHGVPVSPFLLPSGDRREQFLENGGGPFDHFLWLDFVDLNSTEIEEMINALVENDIPVDPTLSIYEAILKEDRQGFSNLQDQLRWAKVLELTEIMYNK